MMLATCLKCGRVFDFSKEETCPACKAGLTENEEEQIIPTAAEAYYRSYYYWTWNKWPGRLSSPNEEEAEIPKGCKIPIDEAAQIYELRRMFRL